MESIKKLLMGLGNRGKKQEQRPQAVAFFHEPTHIVYGRVCGTCVHFNEELAKCVFLKTASNENPTVEAYYVCKKHQWRLSLFPQSTPTEN